jgi:ribosome recycling factor
LNYHKKEGIIASMDGHIQQQLKQQLQRVLDVMKNDIGTIRTGRATPSLVENIVVTVYGGSTKLKVMEVATVGATDAQSLVITPYDASIIDEIRKGIMESNTGLNPMADGQVIRISIPPLTKERREELIKLMKHKLENGKIMVRQTRQKAMDDIKKQDFPEDDEKRLEKEVQKTVDDMIETIESMGKQKEAELLQL